MSRRVRRALFTLASASSVLIASLGAAAPASAAIVYVAELTGDAEVPGPGDPDGSGFVQLSISAGNGRICWAIVVEDIAAATAAHVHVGAEGVAGGVVVPIGTPDSTGQAQECSTGHDEAALQAIVDDPGGHYVNVHNDDFPDGAIRGQLEAIEVTEVVVLKVACPAGIDTPEEVEAAGGPIACAQTGTVDSIGDPPPGYVWNIEPIEFDLQLTLETPDESLTLDDAVPGGAGDGGCDPATLVCNDVNAYTWQDVTTGETTLTQVTVPDGYEFGWADVTVSGDPDQLAFTVTGSSITFDTAGFDGVVTVIIYDVVATGVTPTPTPDPGATARPTVTPPATDTGIGVTSAGGSSGGLAAALTVIGMLGAGIALAGRRVRPTR